MPTLLAVYNSEGCVGRCDSRCYLAHKEKCVCICGGANHGVGLRRALDNADRIARAFIEQTGDGALEIRRPEAGIQLELFDEREITRDAEMQ